MDENGGKGNSKLRVSAGDQHHLLRDDALASGAAPAGNGTSSRSRAPGTNSPRSLGSRKISWRLFEGFWECLTEDNDMKMWTLLARNTWPLLLPLAMLSGAANARVVINEVFYHAPDDIEDLEYIELHNSSDQPVDLSG